MPRSTFRVSRRGMKPGQRRAERETSAGGVIFRRDPNGTPRYLLIRDSYRNWGFPKGHLEPGEPPADAAQLVFPLPRQDDPQVLPFLPVRITPG
jgi:hypothetical protein